MKLHFDRVLRLGIYEGTLRSAVLRIKQPRERPLAMALGELVANCLGGDCAAWRPDAVVPVPMHWSRKLWRGANSPEVIGELLAKRLQVPLAGHLLVRQKRTAPQASLSVAGRRANVKGAFRVRKHRDLDGARLLLVDDIMTTGATLNEAAKTLSRGGASSVAVAVLARAERLV